MYDFPGQKRDPPEQRDPLRIFYETLYQQKPTSELAAVWMLLLLEVKKLDNDSIPTMLIEDDGIWFASIKRGEAGL
ncbi:uncharacterized protein LOC104905118 isoform X2 [Beta vulgaris subsp. vulgaris]|uniref:uncharacterized protein LOC104905118 isoform X2 n=1 Tax=Beta vulgaris subsp. vulgaris TaxID=3555 RepID=UPI002547C437|nr:uncharacterized protein LOC104905118 isoform X2 [Beta vulgaris subsp. vulgaris]